MAGMGDTGEPNGLPVDEWGMRVNEKSQPVGSCVAAAARPTGPRRSMPSTRRSSGLRTTRRRRPMGMTFGEAGRCRRRATSPSRCSGTRPLPRDGPARPAVMNEDGTPKWRMAPSPHGAYWEEGMKVGYQDVGSWTLMKARRWTGPRPRGFMPSSSPPRPWTRKKPCRADLHPRVDRSTTKASPSAPRLGGLVEFYRSPARVQWSPTGTNIPDYPKLAQLWWQNIGDAMSGAKTPRRRSTASARHQEQRAGAAGTCRHPGRSRPQAERGARSGVLAEPAGRAQGQA